jgi:hypothetical protein
MCRLYDRLVHAKIFSQTVLQMLDEAMEQIDLLSGPREEE